MFERLQEEYGFTGGCSTVRRAVAQLRQSTPEVFIPLPAAPGEQVQIDFGHAQVTIAGVAGTWVTSDHDKPLSFSSVC